jgi:hypothetical protein
MKYSTISLRLKADLGSRSELAGIPTETITISDDVEFSTRDGRSL